MFLWGNLVAYGAKKQGHVSLSPYEAELGGVTRGCVEAKHIAYMLLGMRIMIELPIPTYSDNESVLNGIANVTHESSAKHIDTRHFWLKNDVARNIFEPMHVLGGDNMTDAMTKALAGPSFWRFMDDLSGKAITEVGAKIRRGQFAYKYKKKGRPDLARPEVKLCKFMPGPEMDVYYGTATVPNETLAVGACE